MIKLGQGVRNILSYATYDCALRGKTLVEPDHLLLGLFREDFILVDAIASFYRLNSLKVLENVLKNNPEAEVPVGQGNVVFGPRSLEIIYEAGLEAESFGHSLVRPEHLFLGILEFKRAILPHMFLERAVTVKKVRQLVSYLRFDSVAPRERSSYILRGGARLEIDRHIKRDSLFNRRQFEMITLRLYRRF